MTVPSSDQRPAAERWAHALAGWGLPEEILAAAPCSPWIVPPALFRVRSGPADPAPDTPSHRLARAALPAGGSVLDVGCGGGRAALAVAPPACTVIGVDEKPALLAEFALAATARGVRHTEIQGRWPDVAPQVDVADVAVCHHVAYNVAYLEPFALALAARARRRVVLELSWCHPLTYLGPLWRRFWGLDRPAGPTALDAADVLREAGLPVRVEEWTPGPGTPSPIGDDRLTLAEQVEITRIRLCLGAERDPEIAQALAELGPPPAPRTVTLWWDVPARVLGEI